MRGEQLWVQCDATTSKRWCATETSKMWMMPRSPWFPPGVCVSLIGVIFHPQIQCGYKVTQLLAHYRNSRSRDVLSWICIFKFSSQISCCRLVFSTTGIWVLFPSHHWPFSETDRPFSAASSTVSNLLGGRTNVQLFSIALAVVINWLPPSQVYFEW